MKKLYNFFYFPLWKKKLIAQSLFWVILYRLCLWCMPYKMLKKIIPFENLRQKKDAKLDWNEVKNVVDAIRLCSYYVPYATCLTQALATRTILRSRGQSSQLRIGVGRDENNEFIAHAWIESDGKIIIGKSANMYRYSMMSDNKN